MENLKQGVAPLIVLRENCIRKYLESITAKESLLFWKNIHDNNQYRRNWNYRHL
jgi:hypothetical protein